MYYYQDVQGGPFSELDEIQHFKVHLEQPAKEGGYRR